jgi:DNA-binding beta-propeller fold protein YncE
MKKKLDFSIAINAPRRTVWNAMLSPDGYRYWTAAFTEGSYFEGSWEKGKQIRFMSPSGDGMVSEIAENRPFEHVSIRHLGIVKNGVDDTTSPEATNWAPAYENYTLTDEGRETRVSVELDTVPEYEQYMRDTFPKALAFLKLLCEEGGGKA